MSDDIQSTYVAEHGPLQVPIRIISLEEQIADLIQEPAWQRGERVGRTLVKERGLSVVLTVAHGEPAPPEHTISGAALVQCARGNLRLHASGHTIDLTEGELLALEAGVAYDVESIGDAAFLTTIGEQA